MAWRWLKLLLVGMALATSLGAPALAYGPQGHEIIATVARDRLFARDKRFEARFWAIVQADNLTVQYTPKPTPKNPHPNPRTCRATTIAQLANWPDCVRPSQAYAKTAPYHFDDVPRCPVAVALPDKSIYCANGQCATEALKRYIAVLQNSASSPRQKAEALSFIIHIVGDLHQPMHASENGNDRGGGQVKISIAKGAIPDNPGPADNLHSLWDGDLVFAAVADPPVAIPKIRQLADANAASWSNPDPDAWALRSHRRAEAAYSDLTAPPACDQGAADGGKVTKAYVDAAKPDVEENLARAAVQLTDVLALALTPPGGFH